MILDLVSLCWPVSNTFMALTINSLVKAVGPQRSLTQKSASAWLVSGVNVTPNGQSVTELFFHQPLIRSTRSCDARPLFASNAGIVWELLNCSWPHWPRCKCVILYCICTMRRGVPRMLDSTECIEGIWKRTHFWCICMYAPCFCCHTDLLSQ